MMTGNGNADAFKSVPQSPRRSFGYRRARILSWSLFGLAAALAGVFVVHVARFEARAPTPPAAEADAPVRNQVVVTGPTLTGYDDDQLPYSVTAASAVQDPAEPNRVRLQGVSGELRRRSGERLGMSARTALFDSKSEVLQLVGDVTLIAAGRFIAAMDKADVTLADKRLRSQSPVSVAFGRGRITAGGLEISDDGSRIVFTESVKVTFGPQTKGDMLQ